MPDLDQIKQGEQGRRTGPAARTSFRERTVKLALPADQESSPGTKPVSRRPRDIAPAMKAVTSALAGGVIAPGEAGTTAAAVVDIFFRAIEASDFERRSKEAEDGLSRNSGAARQSGVGRSSQLLNEVLLQIRCRSSKR